jgi:RNA polymerase sigma factor (sigma-70 family)
MAVRYLSRFVDRLRNALVKQKGAATDADLLGSFVRQRDEAAFEALVRKHGPMVMGVCLRILHNSHDAEDAFQATFLVLVRKAATIHPPGMVGNWLYGVAYRTAQEARKSAARRRAKEASVVPQAETREDTWEDLRTVLDQELERLPGKYRAVIVLCDLEGKTRKEAAEQLGWPEGTVAGRLPAARTMLAKRLIRHGFGVSAGVLAAMLGQHASAAVSPPVVSATVNAATLFAAGRVGFSSVEVAALTEGVLKSMLLSRAKTAAAVLVLVGFILGGGGLLTWAAFGGEGQAEIPQEARSTEQKKRTNSKDKMNDAEAEARLREAQAAFQAAEAKLREAQGAVPDAAAMLRLRELREGLREQRSDLLLLALELEKQKGRLRSLKERLEHALMRAAGNDEEKKSLSAAVRQELEPLSEKTADAAERIEIMRKANDVMLDRLDQGEQGTHRGRLQELEKEIRVQNEYGDWPELQLARVRESLRGLVKVGLERAFKNAVLNAEDKTFLVDTLNKEIDPIVAKADEIDGILGRVRAGLTQALQDGQKGAKQDE